MNKPDSSEIICQGLLQKKHRNILHVDWTVNSICNYKCSYCFSPEKPKQEKYYPERITRTIDNILFLKRPFYSFRILGGEPTLFPHFGLIVEQIFSRTNKAGILTITNGSRAPDWFENNLARVPSGLADIHISLHLEFADPGHISDIINTVSGMGQNVVIRFMYNPELREKARKFVCFLTRLRETAPFSLHLRALREPPSFTSLDRRYVQEDIEWMDKADAEFAAAAKESGLDLPAQIPWGQPEHWVKVSGKVEKTSYNHNEAFRNSLMAMKGFWCNPEHATLCIDPGFRWRGGTCDAFPWMPFPIDSEEFQRHLPGLPVQCPMDNCGCDAVYFAPKFKDQNRALWHRRRLLLTQYFNRQKNLKHKLKCILK